MPRFEISSGDWRSLQMEFENAFETIRNARIPPTYLKKDKHRKEWLKTLHGENFEVPLSPITDPAQLTEWRDLALSNARWIEKKIKARRMSHEFVIAWGDFMYNCGLVLSSSTMEQDNIGHKRSEDASRKKVSIAKKKAWVANQLQTRMARGMPRYKAERELVRDIVCALKSSKLSEDEKKLLKSILTEERNVAGVWLKQSYVRKRFPEKEFARFIELMPSGLPKL